ncbi:response regulator [Corallococcus sp. AB018]|uniref:phosphorylase family protein n=1 Tax=Corallococcus sp. AB018 TaxID=2316715 RepID=UPI000F87CF77|nr:response regulator [Corallococcus sp. AB018]RUO93171.1 response regulator [Corallococcus sp. AB018]
MSLSVLIVDDEQVKLQRLVAILTEAGVGRDDISIAQNCFDAREKLRRNSYGLMVLDLALPNRPEDRPSDSGGLDLIEEIHVREGYYRPAHIVAVTAREDLSREHEDRLAERLINLLFFDQAQERWQNQIRALVADLLKIGRSPGPVQFGVDVCVVTALREPELKAVRNLPWRFGPLRLLDHTSSYYEGSFEVSGRRFSVVATAAPRMGLVASALHTMKFIEAFRPRILVMAGICGGVVGRADIGDVVLATPVWEWQSGKRVRDEKSGGVRFQSDPHQLDVEPIVSSRYERMIEDGAAWAAILGSWPAPKPKNPLRGVVGPVASGSSVLADGLTVSEIKDAQHRKLTAIEMEIYGVYAAAREASEPRPLVFALKAVSDLSDSGKSDDFQDYASHVSAQVVRVFLEKNILEFVERSEGGGGSRHA